MVITATEKTPKGRFVTRQAISRAVVLPAPRLRAKNLSTLTRIANAQQYVDGASIAHLSLALNSPNQLPRY